VRYATAHSNSVEAVTFSEQNSDAAMKCKTFDWTSQQWIVFTSPHSQIAEMFELLYSMGQQKVSLYVTNPKN